MIGGISVAYNKDKIKLQMNIRQIVNLNVRENEFNTIIKEVVL